MGKAYSAKAILERCTHTGISAAPAIGEHKVQWSPPHKETASLQEEKIQAFLLPEKDLIDVLLTPEKNFDYLPRELKKPKKKKHAGRHLK